MFEKNEEIISSGAIKIQIFPINLSLLFLEFTCKCINLSNYNQDILQQIETNSSPFP